MSSWERGAPSTVVDPEALLLSTIEHDDLRLRGEVAAWFARFEHLIHVRRLRALAAGGGGQDRLSNWLDDVASTRRQESTFRLPDIAAAAALRLRAVTGTTARAELVRELHGVLRGDLPPLSTSDLVDKLALTRAQVNRAMTDLVDAGLVEGRGTPKRQRFIPIEHDPFARAFWSPWREYPFAPWLEVGRAATALVAASDRLAATDRVGATSDALELYHRHSDTLSRVTGRRHPIHRPGAADEVARQLGPILDDTISVLIDTLDGDPERQQLGLD